MQIWIGKLNGDMVVFEEKLQITESKYLKLWSFEENDVLSFDREVARSKAETIKDQELKQRVAEKYSRWVDSSFALYITEERQAAKSRRGMELAKKQIGRESYCHTCGTPLKAMLTNVCGKCGWISCPNCGGCNCPS